MAVHAIIPVKELATSKRRLSKVFTPRERATLTLAMLNSVLKALGESVVNKCTVVSNDAVVHHTATQFGVSFISTGQKGLNPVVAEATQLCVRNHLDSMLVLPADIPLITPKDIDMLVKLGSEKKTVVLSPSSNGGTNALFENPPDLIRSKFGQNSFVNHAKEACKKGMQVKTYISLGTWLDIDSVEDLKRLLKIENATGNVSFLKQSGLLNQTKAYALADPLYAK